MDLNELLQRGPDPLPPGAVLPAATCSAVDLDRLADAIAYIEFVNRLPLHKIKWIRNDKPVPVTVEQISEWKFTGLNNRDFAREHLLPNLKVSDRS